MTSRVDPLLPVKPSASAARATRPARVAEQLAGRGSHLEGVVAEHDENALARRFEAIEFNLQFHCHNEFLAAVASPSPYAPKAPESIAGGRPRHPSPGCRDRPPANVLKQWGKSPRQTEAICSGRTTLGVIDPCVSRGVLPPA